MFGYLYGRGNLTSTIVHMYSFLVLASCIPLVQLVDSSCVAKKSKLEMIGWEFERSME